MQEKVKKEKNDEEIYLGECCTDQSQFTVKFLFFYFLTGIQVQEILF